MLIYSEVQQNLFFIKKYKIKSKSMRSNQKERNFWRIKCLALLRIYQRYTFQNITSNVDTLSPAFFKCILKWSDHLLTHLQLSLPFS